MRNELIKILKLNFIGGFVWITMDMLLYFHHHHQFSWEELKIASRPVAATLLVSIIYIGRKFRNK